MKILLPAAALLLVFTIDGALSATCTYDQSANQVTCGRVRCSTVGQVSGGKLPLGRYRIGTFYSHSGTPWFNLYPERSSGGYWDYYTRVPELGCRGGFGLHPGTISLGCITVTDGSCFNHIKAVVESFSSTSFTVTECRVCWWGICAGGTGTLSRRYRTDLQVVR